MKNILVIFILLTSLTSTGQTNEEVYKTFSDTTFEKGDVLIAPTIYFTLSGSRIISEHNDSIKVIADFLKKHSNIQIEIGGHTDSRGSAKYNLKISENRAEFVKQELIQIFGIKPHRIESKGYGESDPIILDEQIQEADSEEEKERLYSKNRRMELIILDV